MWFMAGACLGFGFAQIAVAIHCHYPTLTGIALAAGICVIGIQCEAKK